MCVDGPHIDEPGATGLRPDPARGFQRIPIIRAEDEVGEADAVAVALIDHATIRKIVRDGARIILSVDHQSFTWAEDVDDTVEECTLIMVAVANRHNDVQ